MRSEIRAEYDTQEALRSVKMKPTRRTACSGIWAWKTASRCVTVCALLLTLDTTAYSQPSRREIPFENSHLFGLVLVKVEVNGGQRS